MKVLFLSNFLNHHQYEFCNYMFQVLGGNFKFVATEQIPLERLNMGYYKYDSKVPFLMNYDKNDKTLIDELILSSDIVIIGSSSSKLIKNRIKKKMITFFYLERIFKHFPLDFFDAKKWLYILVRHFNFLKKNQYLLSAGAFTPNDFRVIGSYKNRSFKWGYFPRLISYTKDELITHKKGPTFQILWVGRLIKYKNPLLAIFAAIKLKKDGYIFNLEIIGEGPLKNKLTKLVNKYSLSNYVTLTDFMDPESIRTKMLKANVYLFTSNSEEGWGAVLNEAMNAGCTVIASNKIGSVPYLINNNQNGLVFKSGSINSLYKNLINVIKNPDLSFILGLNAYNTISNHWNSKKASINLLSLFKSLIDKKEIPVFEGPCSEAKVTSYLKVK
jgi:glycosyltransferase involved in cell wall biosynthesis